MTCFHLAVRQGHTDLIKLLLKTGQFDINEKVNAFCKLLISFTKFIS